MRIFVNVANECSCTMRETMYSCMHILFHFVALPCPRSCKEWQKVVPRRLCYRQVKQKQNEQKTNTKMNTCRYLKNTFLK